MTTLKRLKDEDVNTIFDCIRVKGQKPPPHLTFQIIKTGPDGMGLSPPSYEFEGKQLCHRLSLHVLELKPLTIMLLSTICFPRRPSRWLVRPT